jgi:hypothetical protein
MRITEIINEGKRPGLWANIHAKQDRIKNGSGERMRKPGSKGAPTAKNFKDAATESMDEATGDVKFDRMMGNISSPAALDTREALAMIRDLVYQAGASYQEALQQASTSYEIDPVKLDDLYQKQEQGLAEGENWSKHNHKRVGGMSDKSVKSYRRSHPGSKIQTAVTTKPSKIKKGSKDAGRRKSFCARMQGMKKHNTSAKTAHDPTSNINKSLRRWHCESIEQMQELVIIAEQFIATHKKELK